MTPLPLPYAFARARGVLLRPLGDGYERVRRRDASLEALVEAARIAPAATADHVLDEAGYEAALRDSYQEAMAGAADAAAAADIDLAALADSAANVDDLLDGRDDSPVVRLINALLLEAVKAGASDIHVETRERSLVVRFRVDGVLKDVLEPARALAPLLVSRIKVMARLDIAEKRVPQDGRVTLRVGGHAIDTRVSTIPAQHGERVVMRLLDRDGARLDLDRLGMSAADSARLAAMLDRPHGMLLVTGPTGSGKTTTLYAALERLNDGRRNIMTVEDPIEYALDGIAQTQVNQRIGMDFARGLRAILRQDPDIIMVGEIRDGETAGTAVRASMTGHFMLSTLHTNSAVGAVTRLADMGVERYLLAPMLVGLMAQRLVRRLCEACRLEAVADARDHALLPGALAKGARVFRAAGCEACGDGYRGRTGLYELVALDGAMAALVHDGAPEAELTRAARERGPSLLDDGAAKIAAGLTTVDEVARVAIEGG